MDDHKGSPGNSTKLKRSLNLTLLTFYGLGVTIGAGIYVLIGAAAGHAGMHAPLAFLMAAICLAPTTMSFSELSGRYPVSAGEAVYVREGFRSRILANLTGWMVVVSGVVSSATISLGCAGYLTSFIDIPTSLLIIAVIVLMSLVAIWGITESVILAAIFTMVEAGGLLVLIIFGLNSDYFVVDRLGELVSNLGDGGIWLGIFNASILGVFAFIGFEDMVNVAEEVKNPKKTMPRAIFLTLIITAVLYILVTIVAIFTVAPEELSTSEAPLSLVFERLTGLSPIYLSAIAIFATANTILVQFIMASRVVYGMADRTKISSLKILASVNPKTQTPIIATVFVAGIALILALAFPLGKLAEFTSQAILLVWFFVNIALLIIKIRDTKPDPGVYVTPIWIPFIGALFCLIMIVMSLIG